VWIALPLLLLPFLFLSIIDCCCTGLKMFEVLDGTAEKRRTFLPVFLSWSAALQLSTRWAAALYSQAGSSAAAFASVYAILLFPLLWFVVVACKDPRRSSSYIFYHSERFVFSFDGSLICCVLIGVAIPLAVLLVVRPVSGSDYLSIISTDFSMRNTICYLDLVYSNKHDSVVGLIQRIGL
jgi:hypothetical protein